MDPPIPPISDSACTPNSRPESSAPTGRGYQFRFTKCDDCASKNTEAHDGNEHLHGLFELTVPTEPDEQETNDAMKDRTP